MASLKIVLPSEVDAVNPTIGDLYLTTDKKLRMTASLTEEVAQQLYIRFKMLLGEWFRDPSIGVPWLQTIFQKVPHGIRIQILKRVITTCPGVTALTSFTYVPSAGRRAEITFACQLTDGAILTSAQFGPFVIGLGA